MLCAFIIPSRGRPDGLHRAIHSILSYADNPGEIEFVIGFDNDDSGSLIRVEEFEKYSNTKILVVNREPLAALASRLLILATSKWVCMFNDDAFIQGQGWDSKLACFPTHGVIVQPEIYQLNDSEYRNATRTGFPFFPNGVWNMPGFGGFINAPNDYSVCDMAERKGWKIEFLKGVTILHDRKADATLPAI